MIPRNLLVNDIKSLLHEHELTRGIFQGVPHISIIRASQKRDTLSVVANLSFGDQSYIIKFYPASDRYVKKEVAAINLLAEETKTLPEIITYQVDTLPAFLIERRVPGTPFSACNKVVVKENIGSILEQISVYRRVSFTEYGEIAGKFPSIPNTKSFQEYTQTNYRFYLDGIIRAVKMDNYHPLLKELKSFNKLNESVLSSQPCLCHSDITLENIILSHDKPFIIDFDNAFAFTPDFDICKFFIDLSLRHINVDINEFSRLAAFVYGVKHRDIMEMIKNYYWYVAARILNVHATLNNAKHFNRIGRILLKVFQKISKKTLY